jgi:hypothetical protein
MRQDDIRLPGADVLSTPARELLAMDAANAYEALVVSGPGRALALPILSRLSPQTVLNAAPARPDYASALIAALWLWHDFLDESHRISQGITSETGSFWHAIMHRREGDFSNSKYWYRRCRNHATYAAIAAGAQGIINPYPADKSLYRLTSAGWDPDALVDLVEAVHDQPDDPRSRVAVALQQLEWRTLFDYCTRQAL